MYRFGERQHGHRRLYISLAILIVFVAGVIGASKHFMTSDTHISKAPAPLVGQVMDTTPPTTTFREPLFSIALPKTWATRPNNDIPQPTYSWHGTVKDDATRWMSVYVDAIPATLPVNRVQPIAANGTGLSLPASMSDNCTTFTGAVAANQPSVTAKWQGITFLCDTGNYIRDVVGTSSLDGINTVAVKSPANGTHHFFFTYTDNSPSPDYTIFTEALKSFQLK